MEKIPVPVSVKESFDHKKFRDDLASDLKTIKDHAQRAQISESEKGGVRYEIAKEKHLEDIQTGIKERAVEVLNAELQDKPLDEIIASFEGLSEKMECLSLDDANFSYLSILRLKEDPSFGALVNTCEKDNHATASTINIKVPTELGSIPFKKKTVCGCCNPLKKSEIDAMYEDTTSWKSRGLTKEELVSAHLDFCKAFSESLIRTAQKNGIEKIWCNGIGALPSTKFVSGSKMIDESNLITSEKSDLFKAEFDVK